MHYRLPKKRVQGETWLPRLLESRLFFFLALAILLLVAYSTTKAFLAWRLAREGAGKLQTELDSLKSDEQEFARLKAAQEDPAFQELEARRLGMKKPGEEVVVIVPPQERQETSDKMQMENKKGWWASVISKLIWWR